MITLHDIKANLKLRDCEAMSGGDNSFTKCL